MFDMEISEQFILEIDWDPYNKQKNVNKVIKRV